MTTYPSIKAEVNGKSYLAVSVGNIPYLIWTVTKDTSAPITKILPGDVEINGVKPTQVYDGHNTYIKASEIPTLATNPTRDRSGTWQFYTKNYSPPNATNNSNSPILDLTQPEIKSLVYVKTNVNGWFFDAVIDMNHSSDLTITSHPVQTGNAVSDYAYMEPRKLTMTIAMSDASSSLIAGQFSGPSRSVEAWNILRNLQSSRVPVQVTTRLGVYQNMLIKSLSEPDNNGLRYGLQASVTFQELLVAEVKTVKISALPSTTSSANKGAKTPKQVPQQLTSALSYLKTGLGSLWP